MTASSKKAACCVGDFCRVVEAIAPTALAQSWDNVGLLVGDPGSPARRVLLCIDLTDQVVAEAVRARVDLVLAYHPPIFKPIHGLRTDKKGTDAAVHRCIRGGMAIYATHTALDASDAGTNAVIADACGITETEPLEYVDSPRASQVKVVVFVPPEQVENVARAMFAAGAGRIGEYSQCSYRSSGRGTFLGGAETNPTIGQRGRLEFVDETRLETVVETKLLPNVVEAMRRAHSYEEPAFDVYPLTPPPARGIGRVGALPRPIRLDALARKLKRAVAREATGGDHARPGGRTTRRESGPRWKGAVQMVGPEDRVLARAIIVVGAAGNLPFRLGLSRRDVIITGEIRHHDALTILRHGATAIALGHWASERPVLAPLATMLQEALPSLTVRVSHADSDPFRAV